MIAIVTGASSGIGSEFCRLLDSRGLDRIWIVARRKDRLDELALRLKTPCRVIVADLSSEEGLGLLRDTISAEEPEIAYLVNCAGMGRFGLSWEIPQQQTDAMIDLNVRGLADVTSFCIPYMPRGSHIIQVCSASAYVALPQLNVYAATKAFVKRYCDGIRHELRDRGVSVLEVSPGWVDTDFIRLSKENGSVPDRVFRHTVTKEAVASKAMSDADKGRKRSVCGFYNRLQVFVCSHMPSVAGWVWRRSLR